MSSFLNDHCFEFEGNELPFLEGFCFNLFDENEQNENENENENRNYENENENRNYETTYNFLDEALFNYQNETFETEVETQRMETEEVEETIDDQIVQEFWTTGCGCASKCTQLINVNEAKEWRAQFLSLEKNEQDMYLKGYFIASQKSDNQNKRLKRSDYSWKGVSICRDTFQALHGVYSQKMTTIKKHLEEYGLCERVHKNTGRAPQNRKKYVDLSFDHSLQIVNFLTSYANEFGLKCPGRHLQQASARVLLPTSHNQKYVWGEYKKERERENLNSIGYKTFLKIWKLTKPEIQIMSKSTDLCEICERLKGKILSASSLEKEKSVNDLSTHLQMAANERKYYNEAIAKAKEKKINHISFDYAQSVQIPFSPQQIGPMYFLSPKKVNVFGVCDEGERTQKNYLISEESSPGKGADATISLLHHSLQLHNFQKEKQLHLTCDNCGGQNKNNAMMWFLSRLVELGKYEVITLQFMIAGHTKFSPDGFFGLFKQVYRKTKINCIEDLTQTFFKSTNDHKSSSIIVDNNFLFFEWSAMLSKYYKKIDGLNSFHHFTFKSPGIVIAKALVDGSEVTFDLKLTDNRPTEENLPQRTVLKGLSDKRKWYLYQKIRPFVEPQHQDEVAPLPASDAVVQQSLEEEIEKTPLPDIPYNRLRLFVVLKGRKPKRRRVDVEKQVEQLLRNGNGEESENDESENDT